MDRKMVPLHRDESEMELWERAESKARKKVGKSAREGEVLAHICAEFLGEEKPFRRVEQ